jgi:copper homeostasis protein CutC
MIGMIVPAQCVAMRRVSAEGVIRGHGGDLYYVQHETHDLNYAVHCFTEFEAIS